MTLRTVHIDGTHVEYSLRKRRGQRSYTLSVHESGKVTLTVPKITTIKMAERFMKSKSKWLHKTISTLPKGVMLNQNERKIEYKKHKEKARKFVTKEAKRAKCTLQGTLQKGIYTRELDSVGKLLRVR